MKPLEAALVVAHDQRLRFSRFERLRSAEYAVVPVARK